MLSPSQYITKYIDKYEYSDWKTSQIDLYSDMVSGIPSLRISSGLMDLSDIQEKVQKKINKATEKQMKYYNDYNQMVNSVVDDKVSKMPTLPKQLWNFCEAMQSKSASARLHETIFDLAEAVNQNTVFVTKIGYYVDSETNDPYLIVSSLSGKESFKQMVGNLEEFVNKAKDNPYKVYLFKLDNELTQPEFDLLNKYNDYCQKKISKDEAKSLVTVRYKIGDVLMLKSKIRDGSKRNYRKFVVKKIIWSINSNPVNIIIVKQVSGPVTNMSMSKNDCKRYHIKYEENLQVYSMMMNFVKIADK